jgi:large subunit ribosomal protein L4
MTIDVYTSTGTKKGTVELPKSIFGAAINEGLMHQAVVRQQSNRRNPIAHARGRSEVQGSTRKLYQQKGTGRARRGSIRSPLMRGGGKAFGPRSIANFEKKMPRGMRRQALFSSLSYKAEQKAILGLENYPEELKTKTFMTLLGKLPVNIGRRILVVTAANHRSLILSSRNVSGLKTVTAAELNPEDVLVSHHIIFLVDAIAKAEEIFGKEGEKAVKKEKAPAKKKAASKAK